MEAMRGGVVCAKAEENAAAAWSLFLDPIADLVSSWRSPPGCAKGRDWWPQSVLTLYFDCCSEG